MADQKTAVEKVKATTLTEAFQSDKKDWRWVKIPALTILGYPYDDIGINNMNFAAGDKHFLPPQVADEVEAIKLAYEDQVVRINSDQRRLEMLRRARLDTVADI